MIYVQEMRMRNDNYPASCGAIVQECGNKRKTVTPSWMRPITPGRIPGHDKEHRPMQKMIVGQAASMPAWETIETFARAQVHGFIQQLLEDEVSELLG